MLEIISRPESVPHQYEKLLGYEPNLISAYVPANATEQRMLVLRGEMQIPDHTYPKLENINFEEQFAGIAAMAGQILENPSLNPKHAAAYEDFIDGYQKKTRLMQLAHEFKHAENSVVKQQVKDEYMRLNIELYGEPDETVYRSLLQEKLSEIKQKELSPRAAELREELFGMVEYDESREKIERFKPSEETVQWMHEIAGTLYDGMLSHIPDQKTFSPGEARDTFDLIIREEFGEAAEGWTVKVAPAKTITVLSVEKCIIIPEDRAPIGQQSMRHLVVHELGVHMLRSVMGGETDLEPLKHGLSGYYDSEEGLGVIMEQALDKKFTEKGIGYYLTAGLAHYDKKNFRETYEVKWRMKVLEDAKDGRVVTELDIAKAKKKAYGATMRSFRGTDELPWFKDLAYYNGAASMWQHLEEIRGDDLRFMFVLMGKGTPANQAHERVMYETATI